MATKSIAGRANEMVEKRLAATRSIWRFSGGEKTATVDLVTAETPLTIFVDGEELVTLLCSPSGQRELAVGFLFAEGMIGGVDDLAEVWLDDVRGKVTITTRSRRRTAAELLGRRTLTSGCGRGSIFYSVNDILGLAPLPTPGAAASASAARPAGAADGTVGECGLVSEVLLGTMRSWERQTPLFAATGGAHAAALMDADGRVVATFEDIGRHNAVDKVIGFCLLGGIPTSGLVLLTTGRLSSEMIVKAVRAGIPIVASRSAPTTLACEFAERLGVTLIGFARGARLNVYAHPERLAWHQGGADG